MRLFLDPRRLISDLSSSKIDPNYETTLELDSHADTCVLGCDALILHDYLRPVSIQGYDPSLGTVQYNTVSGALAYDHPNSGETYHLVVNQAIHMPHLEVEGIKGACPHFSLVRGGGEAVTSSSARL